MPEVGHPKGSSELPLSGWGLGETTILKKAREDF